MTIKIIMAIHFEALRLWKKGVKLVKRKAKIKRDKSDRKSHERPDSAQEKNVLQQLKVAINMRGDKDVEFEDGKQVKVPSKVAQKVLKLNDTMKPQEKGEFQRTIAKSYKDLLNAIKGK